MSGNPGLFIPGPTNMPMAVQRAMTVALEDQRSPDFPKLTLPLFRDLEKGLQDPRPAKSLCFRDRAQAVGNP